MCNAFRAAHMLSLSPSVSRSPLPSLNQQPDYQPNTHSHLPHLPASSSMTGDKKNTAEKRVHFLLHLLSNRRTCMLMIASQGHDIQFELQDVRVLFASLWQQGRKRRGREERRGLKLTKLKSIQLNTRSYNQRTTTLCEQLRGEKALRTEKTGIPCNNDWYTQSFAGEERKKGKTRSTDDGEKECMWP